MGMKRFPGLKGQSYLLLKIALVRLSEHAEILEQEANVCPGLLQRPASQGHLQEEGRHRAWGARGRLKWGGVWKWCPLSDDLGNSPASLAGLV